MDDNGLSRRQFFKRGVDKATTAGVDLIEQWAEARARRWIRPPFAQPELDFLLACTRCDACIEACPHQVIFPLPFSCGAEVASTPALDLQNRGCHLCTDWPCVQACEVGALAFPKETAAELKVESVDKVEPDTYPGSEPASKSWDAFPSKLATVKLDTTLCLPYNGPECGACKGSCPVPGALLWQGEKPFIDGDVCVGCALCREACIVEPKAFKVSTAR